MKNALKPAFEMLRTLCLGKTAFSSSLALRCVGTPWIQDLIQYTAVYGLFSSSFYVNTHTHASTHSHAHIHSVTYATLVLLDPQHSASGTPKWKDLPWSLAFFISKDLLPHTSQNRGELSRAYKQAKLYCLWGCRRAPCFFWALWKLQKDSFYDLKQKSASHKDLVLAHVKPVLLTFYFIFYFVQSLVGASHSVQM